MFRILRKIYHYVLYLLIASFAQIFRFFPYTFCFHIAQWTACFLFPFFKQYHKRAFSNLSLARQVAQDHNTMIAITKESFENMMIVFFDYLYLKYHPKSIDQLAILEGFGPVEAILKKNDGVIFCSAHQANWEIPFLAVTKKFHGIAVGRPIKNHFLYRWITSIREMFGGKMISKHNAIHQCLEYLKKGFFVGMVSDQAAPDSSYAFELFGVRSWTSTAPAVLAYKSNCPLVITTTQRLGQQYIIRFSPLLYPDKKNALKTEVYRLMDEMMPVLERSILQNPGQWLWHHRRFKQVGINHVKRIFRHDVILILLPIEEKACLPWAKTLKTFKKIYPKSFITVVTFFDISKIQIPEGFTVLVADSICQAFLENYSFQLVFNLTENRQITHHYLDRSAVKVVTIETLKKLTEADREKIDSNHLDTLLLFALCKKEFYS